MGATSKGRAYGAAGGGWVPKWTEFGGGTDAKILFAEDVKSATELAATTELKAYVSMVRRPEFEYGHLPIGGATGQSRECPPQASIDLTILLSPPPGNSYLGITSTSELAAPKPRN